MFSTTFLRHMPAITIIVMCMSCGTGRQVVTPTNITGKYWRLVEINSVRLTEMQFNREPFIIFSAVENRLSGNASCNNMFGSYTLAPGNRIRIGQIGATKMACPDMSVEQQLFELLPQAYSYNQNGNVLTLMDSNKTVIARFEMSEQP